MNLMKISIGILAWNEERYIGAMLKSLFAQDIFAEYPTEVICVPNGSTDLTADIAETFPCKVVRLNFSGKSNAWNVYIHELADPNSDFYILMDADIIIREKSTLKNLIQELINHPEAMVATDTPIKDIELLEKKSLKNRLLIQAGKANKEAPGQICGQLYCIRGGFCRDIWIPSHLLVDDGYLKEIVATNFFTEPSNNGRIIRVNNGSHLFKAYTTITDLYKHRLRQIIGQSIYSILKKELVMKDVRTYVKEKNRMDENWVAKLVENDVKNRFWVIQDGVLTHRLKTRTFFSILAFLFELPLFFIANYRIKHQKYQKIWTSK